MRTDDFDFEVPERLIAQNPAEKRSDAKMLVYFRDTGKIVDSKIMNITDYINKDYHLVFNNSRVIPSRIIIKKNDNNREGELLILKIIDDKNIIAITDKNKKYKLGYSIILPDGTLCKVTEEIDNLKRKFTSDKPIFTIDYLNKYGRMPLPPYIRKIPDLNDNERYQTTFSKSYGSAAAPTAGLHFDEIIFNNLENNGINYSFVSLHVGLGTFQPIYATEISEHKIHEEEYDVSEIVASDINDAIKSGKKILPIGTTSLRTIESAYKDGMIVSGTNSTRLYITPGYKLSVASGLFTNFHTPKSSLAVLVASIVGYDNFKKIYNHAIENEYRFFSYGDCMLIL